MIPKPAQYLLRLDDLCPTLSRPRWQRLLPLIEEFKLSPILAVIPDNQDEELKLSPPDPEFWAQMCALEAAGATIALHGLRHLCPSQGRSLLRLHRHSEFAGMPEETQRAWIREGLETLQGHGLHPKIFVAPRHGYDRATLRALRAEGITLISDGFAREPKTLGGVTWIPQQLWGPVEKSQGLWTICLHSNTMREAQVSELHAFLRTHAAQFTSIDRVLAELQPTELSLVERLREQLVLAKVRFSMARKRRKRRSQRSGHAH
jgi:predicted deacetylase